jgi:outer membrane protein TolC
MERNHVPADLSYVGRNDTSQYSVGLGMNQWELDLWGVYAA